MHRGDTLELGQEKSMFDLRYQNKLYDHQYLSCYIATHHQEAIITQGNILIASPIIIYNVCGYASGTLELRCSKFGVRFPVL